MACLLAACACLRSLTAFALTLPPHVSVSQWLVEESQESLPLGELLFESRVLWGEA